MGQKDRRICQTCRSNQSTKSLFLFARLPTDVSLSLSQWADLYYLCRGQGVWLCVCVCVCVRERLFTCGRIWMRRWKWGNYRAVAFHTQVVLMDRAVCLLQVYVCVCVCVCVDLFETQLGEVVLLYMPIQPSAAVIIRPIWHDFKNIWGISAKQCVKSSVMRLQIAFCQLFIEWHRVTYTCMAGF